MDRQEIFIKEFVLGFGFLSGFWIAAGVDPEGEILRAFAQVLNDLGSNLGLIFYIIPIITLIGSLLGAYTKGGKIGLLGVGLAFLGGVLFLKFTVMGIFFVIAGIIAGNIATS